MAGKTKKRTMRQPSNALVNKVQGSVAAPKYPNRQKTKVRMTEKGSTVSGTDFITTFTFYDDGTGTSVNRNTAGGVIVGRYLNPFRFPGTRLTQFANLFQKFCFKRASIRWVPAVPSTAAGQLVCCYDNDPTWAPQGSTDGVLRMMVAHTKSGIFNVYRPQRFDLPANKQSSFYCDTKGLDLRLNNQAVFWAAVVAPILDLNGRQWNSTVGSFVLDWEVDFQTMRIEQQQLSVISDTFQFTGVASAADQPFIVAGSGGPLTQSGVLIFRYVSDAYASVYNVGHVYYYGFRSGSAPVLEEFYIFSSLQGAQKNDFADIIHKPSGEGICDAYYIPIGNPRLINASAAITAAPLLLETDSVESVFGLNGANVHPVSRRFNSPFGYRVTYEGVSDDTEDDLSGTVLVYDSANFATNVVRQGQRLVFLQASAQSMMDNFKRSDGVTAWTLDDVNQIFVTKVPIEARSLIGLIITAAGFLVRAISITQSVVRVATTVVEEVEKHTATSNLRLVNLAWANQILDDTYHNGHALSMELHIPPKLSGYVKLPRVVQA